MSIKIFLFTIKIILTVLSISILFIPYGQDFFPENNCVEESCWIKFAIIDDFEMTCIYVPYISVCTYYFWGRKLYWLKVFIIVLALLMLLFCFFSMMIALQDFIPLIGLTFVSFFHLGVILILGFEGILFKLSNKTAANKSTY